MKGYGLVLGGGGTRGSYEIGVWKTLRELNIPIIAVAGTSVGALNGAMIVQGDYEKAYDLWINISIDNVIKINEEVSKFDRKEKSDSLAYIIKSAIQSGGLDITPLRKLLSKNIDEEKIRKSKIEFGFVTFSITDFKPIIVFKEDVPQGKMVDYLLASAALPVFQPLEIDGKRFLDGAFYDNLPVSLMVEKSIKDIISVDVSGFGIVKKVKDDSLNIVQIKNSEDLGHNLEFNPELVKKNIKIGYYDTMRTFNYYKGKNYYLTDIQSKIRFDLVELKLIYKLLGIDWDKRSVAKNKFLIYKLIRTIKKYSSSKKLRSFAEFVVAAAEITAEVMEVDRIKHYSLEEIINEIIRQYEIKKEDLEFSHFSKYIYESILSDDESGLTDKIRKVIYDSKFAAIYNVDINDLSEKTLFYRRLLALALPKLCIANIFIAIVNSQYQFD